MSRIKIELPSHFSFQCAITIRITDLNYGGHVGNDTILSLVHKARQQYLQHLGYTEMDFDGAGMIMADAAIEFKSELFRGEVVTISVAAGNISKVGFDLYYKLEKQAEGATKTVALVKTGMICYDYERKKIMPITEAARKKLTE